MQDTISEKPLGFFQKAGIYLDKLWCFLTCPNENPQKWRLLLLLFAALGTLICAFTWYPGLIADDTMTQYLQVVGAAPVSDWHPPIFVRFWQLEMNLFHTANLLDVTWILLSTTGLYLFLRLRPCKFSTILFILLFASPVFFGSNAFLYKDMPLSWLLLIASALIFALKREDKYAFLWKFFITFLLFISCFLRINGIFVAAPLLVATWLEWRFDFKHLVICLFLVIVSLPIIGWTNHHIFKASEDHAEASLEIFDLAGIAFYTQNKKYDDYYERQVKTHKVTLEHWGKASLEEQLATCYTPQKWDTFGTWNLPNFPYKNGGGWNKWANWWNEWAQETHMSSVFLEYGGDCTDLGLKLRSLPPHELFRLWKEAIIHHPIAYLKHRIGHFKMAYLGHIDESQAVTMPAPWGYGGYYPLEHGGVESHKIEYKNVIAQQYKIFCKKHVGFWSNYGIFWLASLLALFTASLTGTTASNRYINLLSFAGLCYFFGYLFVSVGEFWRYIMPSAILCIAALLSWYVGGCKEIGTPTSRKVGISIWIILMFWSSVI